MNFGAARAGGGSGGDQGAIGERSANDFDALFRRALKLVR